MFSQLSKLHSECFPNKPWAAEEFAALKKSGAEIVAGDNGFIIWRRATDEAEIISIGVRPAARRSGIAAAMIAIMENELKKTDAKKIFLEVAADNAAAIALYENSGFERIGTRPKYYGATDAITMIKNL